MSMEKAEGTLQNRYHRTRVWWGDLETGEKGIEIHTYRGVDSSHLSLNLDAAKQLRNQLNAAISQASR